VYALLYQPIICNATQHDEITLSEDEIAKLNAIIDFDPASDALSPAPLINLRFTLGKGTFTLANTKENRLLELAFVGVNVGVSGRSPVFKVCFYGIT